METKPPIPSGTPEKRRLLLVDDEPAVLSALRRSLRAEPYEILAAGSAEEALKIMSETPIDVVLTDERMPGMSGSEFLSRIQREYSDTVRILLTAYMDAQAIKRAVNEGEIYRFLIKPWDADELVTVIRMAFARRELLLELRQKGR